MPEQEDPKRKEILIDSSSVEESDGHPVLLTLTTARSGTTLLHSRIRGEFGDLVRVDHETLQHAAKPRYFFRCFDLNLQREAMQDEELGDFIREIESDSRHRPVLIFGNTLSHLAPIFAERIGNRLYLLHLHRNPVVTSASITVGTPPEWWDIGRYEDNPYEIRISPYDPRAGYPEYRERWASMTVFEKTLYQWLERHAFALEMERRYPTIPYLTVRSEELFATEEPYEQILRFMGLDRSKRRGREVSGRKNSRWRRSVEQNPVDESWRSYSDHPRVLELAGDLGHNLDEKWLESKIRKYQLPPGVLPWLRHKTCYWNRRARLGSFLRGLGILPPQPENTAGLPPRSLGSLFLDVFRRS